MPYSKEGIILIKKSVRMQRLQCSAVYKCFRIKVGRRTALMVKLRKFGTWQLCNKISACHVQCQSWPAAHDTKLSEIAALCLWLCASSVFKSTGQMANGRRIGVWSFIRLLRFRSTEIPRCQFRISTKTGSFSSFHTIQ